MKKLILITVANLIALSASAAQEFKVLNQDAAIVARAMLNPSVQKCVKEIESSERANLNVSQVSRNQARLPAIKLSGMLVQGGDIATKSFTLTLTPQLAGFNGIVFDCKLERGN